MAIDDEVHTQDKTKLMPTHKYAYKHLPQFDPVHYRAWASSTHDAFAERGWTSLLKPSEKDAVAVDPTTLIQAKAFITQSIPFEHQYGLEDYKTAVAIFTALEQRYNAQSREDELRLESLLIDMRKLSTDTINEHISKFTSLMASVLAQQSSKNKYDNAKRNQYFLRTLVHARLEDENWIGFQTYLGKTWTTLTPESMYAEIRSWYESNIRPFKETLTPDSDARLLALASGNYPKPRGKLTQLESKDKSLRPNVERHSNLTYDPYRWCDYHRRRGHSIDQCQTKLKDSDYIKFLEDMQLISISADR